MELSPQALDLANIILKHYDIKKPQENEKKEEKETIIGNDPQDLKTKYSMDYKKFEEVSKENDGKSQEEDPFKTNPYLAQMGCSHDRRKVETLFYCELDFDMLI